MSYTPTSQILARVRELAAPLAASLGLCIWGLELGSGNRPVLRVFADLAANPQSDPDPNQEALTQDASAPSVDIDRLAELSRLLGLGLEVEDLFPDAWNLEVSSPGLERSFFELNQLTRFLDQEIDVSLWEPLEADALRKKYTGFLSAVQANSFALRLQMPGSPLDGTSLEIPWSLVRKARLIHRFDDPQKPGQTAPNQQNRAPKTPGKG